MGQECPHCVSGLTTQTEGHTGTAVHNAGNGAEEARLPCRAATAEPRTAGGAGEPELSNWDPPMANLVSVRLRSGGLGALAGLR